MELTTLGFNMRDCVKFMYIASAHLHINGIFNTGRFYAVNVDPPVNSHGIPEEHSRETLIKLDFQLRKLVSRVCKNLIEVQPM